MRTKSKPKVGDTKVTECISCRKTVECIYGQDPYASEIRGDYEEVWECEECREESLMDI